MHPNMEWTRPYYDDGNLTDHTLVDVLGSDRTKGKFLDESAPFVRENVPVPYFPTIQANGTLDLEENAYGGKITTEMFLSTDGLTPRDKVGHTSVEFEYYTEKYYKHGTNGAEYSNINYDFDTENWVKVKRTWPRTVDSRRGGAGYPETWGTWPALLSDVADEFLTCVNTKRKDYCKQNVS